MDPQELGRKFKERFDKTETATAHKKIELPRRPLEEVVSALQRLEGELGAFRPDKAPG